MDDEIQLKEIILNYYNNKDFVGMINYCNSKIELEDSNYLLFGARGMGYIEMDNFEHAIIDISRALELNPEYASGLRNRGICYYLTDKYDLAIQDLESAKLLNSELENIDYYLGACNYFTENYEKSIDFFSKHLLNIEDEVALKWRAEIYNLTEQFDKAKIDINKLLLNEVKNIERFRKINKIEKIKTEIQKDINKLNLISTNGFKNLKDEKHSGIYILEFSNNEYYIGQAKKIQVRIKQHFKKFNDIIAVFFKPTSEDLLLLEENATIAIFETNELRIRNLKQIEFLNVFNEKHQEKWKNDWTYNALTGSKFNNDIVRDKFAERYLKLKAKIYFEEIIQLLRKYIQSTIPNYLASEFNYWNITCLPNYMKKSNCITRININSVPVLSVFEETDNSLTFMLYVSKLPFLEDLKHNNNLFLTNFKTIPSLRFDLRDAFLEKTEGDEITVFINQKDFQKALENRLLISSIRLFNLRMMNKTGKEDKYRRAISHCLDLSDKILDIPQTLE
ncbi:MAG: GIY-YIG nuclease family protein [Bacteroidetes bacterium]|nr:GIY-YIG nuclease family protein [Bacteroidota bacterium]